MRVLVCNKPGQFEYKEMDKPLLQKGHAMLAVKRIGICGTDLHAYEGTQPFFNYPRILGHELAERRRLRNGRGYHQRRKFLPAELLRMPLFPQKPQKKRPPRD